MHYRTLGCDIQGFRAMGLSVQYWPRWFQDFPAIWLAVSFGATGAHLGSCTLPEKIFFVCEISCFGVNKGFLRENSYCEVFMVTNCSYAGISEWMEISNIFLNNGTCGKTMVKPQTVRYRLIKQKSTFWKYSITWKISLDPNLNCFTRYKYIVIQKYSWINIHEWIGCNFPTWNIRNVCRARDDGHHYDVTSKCCGVTITTRLVEWTLSISEIRVLFCCFQELSGFKKYKWLPKIKCGIKAKRHGRSVLRN